MTIQKTQVFFFLFLTLIVGALSVFVFLPYIGVIFIASVFAIVFYPLHKRVLLRFKNLKTLSAFVSVILIVALVLVPIFIVGILLFQESTDLYVYFIQNGQGMNLLDSLSGRLQSVIEYFAPETDFVIGPYLKQYGNLSSYATQGFGWIITHSGALFSGILQSLLSVFLFLLSLFYFLRDGDHFVDGLVKFSPLKDVHDLKILDRIGLAVNSVVRGYIIIALLQGFIAGIGFVIFGVPNPVIWAFIAALGALLPTIGTGIVMIPAAIYLFFQFGLWPAVGLAVWGLLIVGFVDNLLAPKLIEKGMKIHPFLILLSILGGLEFMGPLGFIAGPVLVSFLFVLFDIIPLVIEKKS